MGNKNVTKGLEKGTVKMCKKNFYFLNLFTRFMHLDYLIPTNNASRYIIHKMTRRQTQVSANKKSAKICVNLRQKKTNE